MKKILGTKVDFIKKEEAIGSAEMLVKSEGFDYIVTPNPEIIVKAKRDREFRNIINNSSLSLPDGIGLTLTARFLFNAKTDRIPGVDFAKSILKLFSDKNWNIFILGGEEGVGKDANQNIKENYGIEVGYLDGEFEDTEAIEAIKKFNTDILFVCLGAPKQEKWIFNNRNKLEELGVSMALGLGGTVDILSNNKKRAPKLLRNLGLEWLWRSITEKGHWKRAIKSVFVYPFLIFTTN